ncbi:MAG TPA: ATP-binding protein [Kofleriaceae bacterium]|nr:ATP-binding protein [Kofleriaceae bacterium]
MSNEPSPASRRILLIEDDADLSEALGDVLEESGHEVIRAIDGEDGLRKLRETRPDIVVLDLMMPHVDGWQFRVAQRRDPALATTPVVVISASTSPTAAAVDADLYLRKPLDAATLQQAIEDVLNVQRRRLQPAVIAQNERLAGIGTLAVGLAHEINNPLTYVILELANAVRLLRTVAADANRATIDELGAHLHAAVEGAERIREITGAIRTFTRPADTAVRPIDVRTPLEAAVKMVMGEVRQRARLTTHYDDVPVVIANEGRLGQVFLNLLTNAAHAIPDGAPETNEIRIVAAADRDGNLVVRISDTGVGIPTHLVGRVFEPFFSTKPVGEGMGLGLWISHNIVSGLGGSLTVSAESGRTTFCVTLPRARAD